MDGLPAVEWEAMGASLVARSCARSKHQALAYRESRVASSGPTCLTALTTKWDFSVKCQTPRLKISLGTQGPYTVLLLTQPPLITHPWPAEGAQQPALMNNFQGSGRPSLSLSHLPLSTI